MRRYGVRLGGIAVLVLFALAAGCAKPPIIERPVGLLGKEEVLSRLNMQAYDTNALRAKVDVKVRTSNMSGEEKTGGYLAAAYPNLLRIRGQHDLLDYPPFDIGSDGKTWFLHTHLGDHNEMHVGSTKALEERFNPKIPLRPSDVVLALGLGEFKDDPPRRELFFTRNPGTYIITEIVDNESGRYVAKRIWVDADKLVITRVETYRPDQGIDMIADMKFDAVDTSLRTIPVSARIRVIRKDQFLLELKLRDRRTGAIAPRKAKKIFAVPKPEDAKIIQHD